MEYEELDQWKQYTYEVQGSTYDVYETYTTAEYNENENENRAQPALNLQADDATLNCLRWLLVDQKDVDLEVRYTIYIMQSNARSPIASLQIKSAPHLENFEYASSDEDIWDALSDDKRRTKKSRVKRKKKKLHINTTCEWQRCNAQFSDNTEYRMHIAEHFEEFVDTQYEEYLCEWDLCGFKTSCLVMFERHVLHHEMHGRFLSAGEALECMNKLPKCTLGGLDRNRLPELLADFMCLWKDCNETCRALSLLHDHLMEHINDSFDTPLKGACQWQGCSYSTTAPSSLKLHASRMHSQILVYACRKCGTSRKSERTFLGHFLSQAPVKSEFDNSTCLILGSSFLLFFFL